MEKALTYCNGGRPADADDEVGTLGIFPKIRLSALGSEARKIRLRIQLLFLLLPF
jgi:hypothetical protein